MEISTDLTKALLGIHLNVFKLYIDYIEDENYPEEKFNEEVSTIEQNFKEILELSVLPEHEEFLEKNQKIFENISNHLKLLKLTVQ